MIQKYQLPLTITQELHGDAKDLRLTTVTAPQLFGAAPERWGQADHDATTIVALVDAQPTEQAKIPPELKR